MLAIKKTPRSLRLFAFLFLYFLLFLTANAQTKVIDDLGNSVTLKHPAKRIVTLAPYLAENVFSAGAGAKLVGTVDYSDYPAKAKEISRVGNYERLDLEAIVALKPDLILAWQSGNTPAQIEKLRALGFTIYLSEPANLQRIASEIENIGVLADTSLQAKENAQQYRKRLKDLQEKYSAQKTVSTFYQVWHQPLTTIGGQQIISTVIQLCGGKNVFDNLKSLAPVISKEAVIAANPQVIIASGMGESRPEWLDDWRKWKSIEAVKNNNLFFVPPELLQRHTFRLLDGTEALCKQLETVRKKY